MSVISLKLENPQYMQQAKDLSAVTAIASNECKARLQRNTVAV